MAWFADLTPYVYDGEPPRTGLLNVGWLDASQPFPTGEVPGLGDALAALQRAAFERARQRRRSGASPRSSQDETGPSLLGKVLCPLCPVGPDRAGAGGELRVHAVDGTTYVAPALIHHYVTKHRYLPPEAFVAAVLRTQVSS